MPVGSGGCDSALAQANNKFAGLVHVMTTEIWQQDRPKGRKPVWAFRVTDSASVIFESRLVSIRLLSRDAASWVAGMIEALHGEGRKLEWRGDPKDDCSVAWQHFGAHAEHLHGPRRGGSWYCSVVSMANDYSSTRPIATTFSPEAVLLPAVV